MRQENAWRTGLAAALAVAIAGCGGGDDGGTGMVQPVPTTVEITPESTSLTFINATQGFQAVVRDQEGKVMPNAAVSWSSSDAGIFTVNGSGSTATVTAAGNGTGTLTASSGQASGTAAVEVAQRAATVEMVSGDDQEAVRGTALSEPLVVRIEDQGGTSVAGVTVTFLPDAGHGSVSETMVDTDADGRASTEWTLGVDVRHQSLVAFVGEATHRFRATATADPPLPDLGFTVVELSRDDPSVLETVDVMAEIGNLGDGATPGTFKLAVSVDAQVVETIDVAQLAPDDTGTVEITLGPFTTGRHTIDLMLDPDGELVEWDAANNAASRTIIAVDQKVIALGESVDVSSAAPGPVFLYRIDIDEASDEALNIDLSGGEGDADLFVHYDERPGHHYEYRCFSGNLDANEDCQLVPTRVGTYHIAVHAYSAFGPSTLEVTVGGKPIEPFDLELRFLEGGSASQRDVIREAADRWESVIARDLNWDLEFTSTNSYPAGLCGPNSPQVAETIDDIWVFVTIDSIDGAGGAVGQASACHVRPYPFQGATGDLQPYTGFVVLDEDDVAQMESQGVLLSVAIHELAHALDVGTGWGFYGLLRNPSLPNMPNADTHFAGPRAIAAFDAVGGAGYAGAKVPVENGAEPGVADTHWRQSVFGDEIMTPFLTGEVQPLSLVTIESLYDLGYEVNLTAADAYSLSSSGVAGMALPSGVVIDLRNDVPRLPIRVLPLTRKGLK